MSALCRRAKIANRLEGQARQCPSHGQAAIQLTAIRLTAIRLSAMRLTATQLTSNASRQSNEAC